jgi:hypothetical protein
LLALFSDPIQLHRSYTAEEDDFLIMIGKNVGEIRQDLLEIKTEHVLGENKENV